MEFLSARPYILYDLKYKLAQKFGGFVFLALSYLPGIKKNRKLELLLASHRASYGSVAARKIRENLPAISRMIIPAENTPANFKKELIGRSIVLKKPLKEGGVLVEKGVMLIKFSETFTLYLRYVDCTNLMKEFHVILEPSWTGHAIEQILGWCQFQEQVYIQCADKPDFDFVSSLNSNLVPLRMGSGEFVDYRIFQPITNEKKYDLVCVANGLVYKRVYAYLKLIRDLKRNNTNTRAALVCAKRGPLLSVIESLISLMGLSSSLDYFLELTQQELNTVIEQSKANILMSYREGSNRVLFEAIFSGTPSVILDKNIGIRKECFTKDSGLVARESYLVSDIEALLQRTSVMQPRAWALNNIAPEVSVDKLINLIESTEYNSEKFKAPIYYKVNSPEATYMHAYSDITKQISDDMLSGYVR